MKTHSPILAFLLLTVGSGAWAQELRVSGNYGWPDHDLLGSPLGVGISGSVQPHPLLGLRIGLERSQDTFSSFGSTCVGLIMPEQEAECAPETRRETSNLSAVVLSVPLTVFSRDRFTVQVVPEFRWSWLESEQKGAVSDRVRSADKEMSGFGIAAEVQYQPLAPWPLHAFLAVHNTLLNRYEDGRLVDGYSPFERDVDLRQVEIGLAYRWR